MANYDALKAIVSDSKNWKAQHEAFGTHLAKTAHAEYLSETASKMIANCKVWIENWQAIQEGVKPELDVIRSQQLEATAEKFIGYSEEQLEALMAVIKAKKGWHIVLTSTILLGGKATFWGSLSLYIRTWTTICHWH